MMHRPITRIMPALGAGGRTILYAAMASGASSFGPTRQVAPRSGAYQTRPAIVCTVHGDLFVAWNELDETGKSVVVTSLPVAAHH